MMMMMMVGFSCAHEKPVKPKHTKYGTSFEFKTSESSDKDTATRTGFVNLDRFQRSLRTEIALRLRSHIETSFLSTQETQQIHYRFLEVEATIIHLSQAFVPPFRVFRKPTATFTFHISICKVRAKNLQKKSSDFIYTIKKLSLPKNKALQHHIVIHLDTSETLQFLSPTLEGLRVDEVMDPRL